MVLNRRKNQVIELSLEEALELTPPASNASKNRRIIYKININAQVLTLHASISQRFGTKAIPSGADDVVIIALQYDTTNSFWEIVAFLST